MSKRTTTEGKSVQEKNFTGTYLHGSTGTPLSPLPMNEISVNDPTLQVQIDSQGLTRMDEWLLQFINSTANAPSLDLVTTVLALAHLESSERLSYAESKSQLIRCTLCNQHLYRLVILATGTPKRRTTLWVIVFF